jgi:COMPASS component SWD1
MNLSLVDPFILAQDCPEVITGRLREHATHRARSHRDSPYAGSGHSTSIRFSHRGDLLASGRVCALLTCACAVRLTIP